MFHKTVTAGGLLHVLAALLALWLGINLLHAGWVGARRLLWGRRVRREKGGLLEGARSYSIGKGPVAVLFIHGFADTPHLWRRVATRLAATGSFTCRAMRLPGSGEPADTARLQSLRRWRASVADELTKLRAGHETVWIAGHSMGGALALDAAIRMPDMVDGVVVFAPLIEVSRRRSPLLPPAVWFAVARVALCLSPTFESPFSDTGVAFDDPGFTYQRDRFIPFAVYRGLFRLVRELRRKAPAVFCPLFAVGAENDAVVDTGAALRWLEGCGGIKEAHVLPDIGHVIPLENGWQRFTDEMAAFIRRNAP
ncbi:MAG: alpha/beta hydrolase [Kiritimatiellae bacterium]|nr:alpha/beta hydrolase [Kiritimatiellia bacterium]